MERWGQNGNENYKLNNLNLQIFCQNRKRGVEQEWVKQRKRTGTVSRTEIFYMNNFSFQKGKDISAERKIMRTSGAERIEETSERDRVQVKMERWEQRIGTKIKQFNFTEFISKWIE